MYQVATSEPAVVAEPSVKEGFNVLTRFSISHQHEEVAKIELSLGVRVGPARGYKGDGARLATRTENTGTKSAVLDWAASQSELRRTTTRNAANETEKNSKNRPKPAYLAERVPLVCSK